MPLEACLRVFPHRIIDDGPFSEKEDLPGKTYFDAHWRDPECKEVTGAAIYDRAIHHASWPVQETGRIQAIVDSGEKVLQQEQCLMQPFTADDMVCHT